jgi:ABC-type Fe3+ transport system permease subunit
MKARYFLPLLGFVVPTVLIGFGLVIPASCIAGVNQLSVGFATTVIGSCITYWIGIRSVLSER